MMRAIFAISAVLSIFFPILPAMKFEDGLEDGFEDGLTDDSADVANDMKAAVNDAIVGPEDDEDEEPHIMLEKDVTNDGDADHETDEPGESHLSLGRRRRKNGGMLGMGGSRSRRYSSRR
jgi:hypothetical protein